MEKNKVLVLAGTLAVSGAMLLHSDVVIAASTTGSATVANTAASNLQNGSYTATAKLYKTGTTNDSMMSSMVLPTANVVIKNEQAIITLRFKDLNTSDMVKSWIIDGVSAVKKDNNFNVVLPVSDLNKTLNSTIHVETMIGSIPFTETQPVDINVTDLKFVARNPEEVAAEQAAEKAAADKAAADKAAADKAAADKAAADKAAADKAAADKAAADKAAADKAAADKAAAEKAAADKAAADKAAAEKAADKAAADKASADKAAQHQQNGSYTATAKLYKTGTTNDSMMSSMVLPTANVVIKNEQAIITLRFKDLNTSDMVKSWIIDGVSAVKKDNNFNVVLPVSDLNKTLNSTIHVETMIGSIPFTETQPVDINVTDLKFVARNPEEVAAEEKAKANADAKAKADAAKAAAATKAKAEQEADLKKRDQSVTKQYTVKLYKTGTTNDSMMTSMVSPTATVVTKDGQATVTLQFKDMATIDMVKSWVIDGVAATKSGQSFVVVLPASDLGKTLKSTIHVETMLGTLPFSETQPVDLLLTPKGGTDDDTGNGDPAPSVPESVGHDVPLTAQLSSTSKLPNTATNETTTAPLWAALVSGVLALGIWFKKVLR